MRAQQLIRPQSMMFTLFGDYIMHRGGEVWVGSLIRIAAQFGLVGDPGLLYEIQWSSDLVRWLSLTNLSSTIDLIQLGDSIATNSSQRFYRAVVPP